MEFLEQILISKHFREIGAYNDLFKGLQTIAETLIDNQKKSKGTSLYTEEGLAENTITKTLDSIKLEFFHGRVSEFHVRLKTY